MHEILACLLGSRVSKVWSHFWDSQLTALSAKSAYNSSSALVGCDERNLGSHTGKYPYIQNPHATSIGVSHIGYAIDALEDGRLTSARPKSTRTPSRRSGL